MELRTHQLECIDNIKTHFKADNKKGVVKMFCGSGKSFIIYHCLLEYGKNLSVIVVPSINLITQFNRDYLLDSTKKEYNKKHFNKKYEILTICSEKELKDADDFEDDEQIITFTTDCDVIVDFLEKEDNKIILVTYKSLEQLINMVKDYDKKIDLICFDEAHHILSDGIKNLLFSPIEKFYDGTEDSDYESDEYASNDESDEDSDKKSIINDSDEDNKSIEYDYESDENNSDEKNFLEAHVDKTIFFTATPKNSNGIKMFDPQNEITIDDECYEYCDDDENSYIDNKTDCGPIIYKYTHINGVDENILNDFKIRVDMYTKNTDINIYEAISRTILETGNNRVLTFHSRSETQSDKSSNVVSFVDQKLMSKCFNKVVQNEFPKLKDKYKSIVIEGITGNSKNKIEILKRFDETPDNKIFILASCKTIGEGVDTKNANMVCFVDPKQSYVEIIQNIGRICRKQPKLSTILIPVHIDVKKYKDCKSDDDRDCVIKEQMNKKGDFNGILNVLASLRHEDPHMFELCLTHPEKYTDKEFEDNFKKNDLKLDKKEYDKKELFEKYEIKYKNDKTEEENFKILSKKIKNNIIITNKKISKDDIVIDNGFKKIIYFLQNENDKYIIINGHTINKIKRPNRNIQPICHLNDEIKTLWKIDSDININKNIFGAYIKSIVVPRDKIWKDNLKLVKKYIHGHGQKPSNHDIDNKIKKLGHWLSTQIYNYNKFLMTDIIKKRWENFTYTYADYFLSSEQIWKNNLYKVKKYMDDYKKKPKTTDTKKYPRQLGSWISTQHQNYKNKLNIMKNNDEIQNLWKKFIDTYHDYFLSNEEQWIKQLTEVEKYINTYGKIPSTRDNHNDIKKLGVFLKTQQTHYNSKNTKHIIKKLKLTDMWKEFIKKYENYMSSQLLIWRKQLNKINNYIIDHEKIPRYNDDKPLATWFATQQKNYEYNKKIMKQYEIRDEWDEFIIHHHKYIISKNDIWTNTLNQVKTYIDTHEKLPTDKNVKNNIKQLCIWLRHQRSNYKNQRYIIKEQYIQNKWESFIIEYKDYFPKYAKEIEIEIKKKLNEPTKKSTTIKIKECVVKKESEEQKRKRINSEYQEITKKMSTQKSSTTKKMFLEKIELWHQYHDYRDFSFKGYDNQDEIPVNKIIAYLETKKNYILKILDLGCGRNFIYTHFKNNKNNNFTITGYDYVSHNGSKEIDISDLPDKDQTIQMCIYSQSLMGYNWKDYLNEGKRVLGHGNGMIISESIYRYDIIKEYLKKIEMHIIEDDYKETNRWFFIYAIKL
jgi:superfamily II DNA or RNA helicase